MFARIAALSIGLSFLAALSATAAPTPTPVPGGANQIKALSGKMGQTIFNGVLRITVQDLRTATDADNPGRLYPSATQKVMVMNVLLQNGSRANFIDLLDYTLADKDGVTFDIGSNYIAHANVNILQGAAARQTAMFPIDKDFVPVKLIVRCATCGTASPFKSIRFAIP